MRKLGVSCTALLALMAVSGCKPRVPCSDEAPCAVDFYCIPDATEMTYCMAECTPSRDGTVCNDGAACLALGADNGFCYSGGSTLVGGNCTTHIDCIRGALCVSSVGSDEAECFNACDLDATAGVGVCPTGRRCVPTVEGNGICV